MGRLIRVLMFPLLVLNTVGWIIAAIWLAILGHWGTLGIALLIALFGAFLLGFILAPGLLLAAPAAWFAERQRMWGVVLFGALSLLYTYIVIAGWSLGTFLFFVRTARSLGDAIPLMLLGYAAAAGPLSFLASKEGDSEGTMITVFVTELALGALMGALLLVNLQLAILAFAAIMLIGYCIQVWLAMQLAHAHYIGA